MFESAQAGRALRPLLSLGTRLAKAPLRPLADVASVAIDAGLELERRAVERVLDSPELERLAEDAVDSQRVQVMFARAVDSRRVQVMFARAVDSDAASRLIATFFESRLFEEIVTQLLESKPLWLLVDEIADSPAVTAAITQQGLGFADEIAGEVRQRSRRTDDLLERAARRLSRRRAPDQPPGDEPLSSGGTA